jgi:hypothetical protein
MRESFSFERVTWASLLFFSSIRSSSFGSCTYTCFLEPLLLFDKFRFVWVVAGEGALSKAHSKESLRSPFLSLAKMFKSRLVSG